MSQNSQQCRTRWRKKESVLGPEQAVDRHDICPSQLSWQLINVYKSMWTLSTTSDTRSTWKWIYFAHHNYTALLMASGSAGFLTSFILRTVLINPMGEKKAIRDVCRWLGERIGGNEWKLTLAQRMVRSMTYLRWKSSPKNRLNLRFLSPYFNLRNNTFSTKYLGKCLYSCTFQKQTKVSITHIFIVWCFQGLIFKGLYPLDCIMLL